MFLGSNRPLVESVKQNYPAGTRIMLDNMGDDPHPIPSGSTGTVECVDDIGTVHVKFDNGRCLGLCLGEDSYHKINEEISEEPQMSM